MTQRTTISELEIPNKTIKKRDILPNKLSELLSLAIKDIEALKKNKNYQFDMSIWHDNHHERVNAVFNGCYICMAGALIAGTLKAPKGMALGPFSYENQKIENKLRAVDNLRGFNVKGALLNLGYSLDSIAFKTNIRDKALKVEAKLDSILLKYYDKTGRYSGYVSNYAHEHLGIYKKFVKLLEKAGL